jgi:hypothetical protein
MTMMRWRSTAARYRLRWPQGSRRLEFLAAHLQGVAVVATEAVAETEVVVEIEAVAVSVVAEAVETEVVAAVVVVVA